MGLRLSTDASVKPTVWRHLGLQGCYAVGMALLDKYPPCVVPDPQRTLVFPARWRDRTVTVSAETVVVRDRSRQFSCPRKVVCRCVVAWTFGMPQAGNRRTRFDPWVLRFLDASRDTILVVADGQHFGIVQIRQVAGVLGVPLDVPDDWGGAQRRWSWARPPAAYG